MSDPIAGKERIAVSHIDYNEMLNDARNRDVTKAEITFMADV